MPSIEPTNPQAVAEVLARASADGRPIVPRGSGTKLAWRGRPADAAAFLSTRGLITPIQHYAGDLVATIPAGVTLNEANAVLGRARQWLPLDAPFADRATIGGIVATNDSGPRRHKHGAPRDLIVGIEVALADGRVVKAGGRVVKNVSGYDLSRLLCGSRGRLGIITSATFKLAPIAPVSRTILADVADGRRAVELAQALAAQPTTPSSIEVQLPRARLLVRFETTERAADRMAATAQALLKSEGASTSLAADADEDELWREHEALVWNRPGSLLKLSVRPTDLPPCLEAIEGAVSRIDRQTSLEWTAIGRAAMGVLYLRLGAAVDERQRALLEELRTAASERGGYLTLLEAPDTLRASLTDRAESAAVVALMRAVEERFDPRGILRFP